LSPKNMDFGDYTLVICEKPDAARRVAEAISETPSRLLTVDGVQAFQSESAKGRYVICAASGHLYGVSDTIVNRRVYPVFDLEWFPLKPERRVGPGAARRIRHIQTLSKSATSIVNACDFDLEGETIGYNILRYACGGKEQSALRARFSTLTREEIRRAFRDAKVEGEGLATAGRLRHVVDFLWGVNLSRALGESLRTGYGYRTVSVGRVQGPTLSFVVEREISIQTFVPVPYWVVTGAFRKDGAAFEARYSIGKIPRQAEAARVKGACEGKTGLVSRVSSTMVPRRPPPPFNLGDLQKESYRLLGYSPRETLRIAERLYLGALISYPRTSSQKLPDIDHRTLLEKIGRAPEYGGIVGRLLSRGLRPREGDESDTAHPAIYPTGEAVHVLFRGRFLGRDGFDNGRGRGLPVRLGGTTDGL
jgi:DNA topoisomerase I